ncbi:MAG: hypothetical protein AAGG47_20265 [Pseudomonadota bacterium]
MTAVLEDDPVRLNDDFTHRIDHAAGSARASGAVGDMIRLRDLRLRAGQHLGTSEATAWANDASAAEVPDLFLDIGDTIPEIDVRALDLARVRSAMAHHGALIVRNLFDPRLARHYRVAIDEVIEAANALAEATSKDEEDTRPTAMKGAYLPLGEGAGPLIRKHKTFLGKSGAIETFLSPKVSLDLLDRFETLGLRRLLQGYFGDEPCLSFNKSVLRRAEPLPHAAEWHQDGAFMTEGIKSLNLWIALSECGGGTDSPGMDLVPRRLDAVLPTGTNGAIFNWSVSGATVAEQFPGIAPARPYFAAGDAIFFDHFNLHATSSDPAFTEPRYAIETWFFAKSRCAVNQHPAYW